jgi:hypothetical protein
MTSTGSPPTPAPPVQSFVSPQTSANFTAVICGVAKYDSSKHSEKIGEKNQSITARLTDKVRTTCGRYSGASLLMTESYR